ncbi:hypothetical protein [Streptomyces sp. B6B3]|uniref:hypothetical protein n=1 Tax=Streptomyces sp. B6B3 TaxID=3153570 RepID=UPI00325E356C
MSRKARGFADDGSSLDACVLDRLSAQLSDLDARIADLCQARTALAGLLTASRANAA